MKKSTKVLITVLICILLPLIVFLSTGFILPAQFNETYMGELAEKTNRLYSIKEEKVIIIGGSSVPFGVDTSLMQEMLGKPVINYGLYGSIGTKAMLDLSKGALSKGDVVVIAPETDAQTYSLYYGAESVWQSCDGNMSLLFKTGADNASAMFGSYWKFCAKKMKYIFKGEKPQTSGVYAKSSFDEYGYIVYDRPYNIMEGRFDATSIIDINKEIISEDFIAYVNEYIDFAEKKGAKVYFSFSPMNEDALNPETTMEDLEAFVGYLKDNLKCSIISDMNSFIYRSGYFYDSNFHMNNSGAVMHTSNLAHDIAKAMDIEIKKEVEIPEEPEVPIIVDPEKYEYDENEVYFTFRETTSGYIITGVTEKGKDQTILTIPLAYNEKKVYSLDAGVFAECDNLKEIFVTKNISYIVDGVFEGAESLEKIHILNEDPDKVTVNNLSGELVRGMNKKAKFYIKESAYSLFVTNYFWGVYTDYLVIEK